jgi:2-hydroxy-4-carboxymuconate semialdehyde hemiacetal dehydrogenase
MDTLNCCLIGYGGIAEFHASACKQIDGVLLRTLMGRRIEPAREFAGRHGFERATDSLEEALADDKLDAVIIASPSEVHYEQTMACLNAGKHVLVEIPLTMSVTSSQRVAARAREVGCNVMVAHTERFIDTRCFAREFLASGEAGAVFHHQIYSFSYRHQNIGWTGYQRSWVDDVVFHHGCHLVDLSLWTIDSPVRRVHGEMAPKHSVNDTSMDVSLLIRYENEAMATISLSYNARQGAGGHRYICEKGVLEYGGGGVLFAGETVFEKSVGELAAIVAQNNEFFASIREDRQPSPNADDGVRALEPLQAVYDQMREFEGDEKYMRRWQD